MQNKHNYNIDIYYNDYQIDDVNIGEYEQELAEQGIYVHKIPYNCVPCSIGDLWTTIIVNLPEALFIGLITEVIMQSFFLLINKIYHVLKSKATVQGESKHQREYQICIKSGNIQILLPGNARSAEELNTFFINAIQTVKENQRLTARTQTITALDVNTNTVIIKDSVEYVMEYIYGAKKEGSIDEDK
jgi:hypothetical protein